MEVRTLFDQLFFITVYLKGHAANGDSWTGTGFVYRVPIEDEEGDALFLVTNKHVALDADRVQVRFISGSDADFTAPRLGSCETIVLSRNFFYGHPDDDIDVCVAPISQPVRELHAEGRFVYFKTIVDTTAFDALDDGAVNAIEAVTFVGYPDGLFDSHSYLPIARHGYTATPPAVDYEGKPQFLIDASVFPGSSGSPVVIAEQSRIDAPPLATPPRCFR
jgi:hypothetical protein